MRVLLSVRQPKSLVSLDAWSIGKKMPASAFPLSKSRSYQVGASWHWCVADVKAGADAYKVLVAFHAGKQEYRAWLSLRFGGEYALLARLEYHRSHKGCHIHCKRGPCAGLIRGVVKEPLERDRSRDCSQAPFGIGHHDALKLAFRAFNVVEEPPSPEGELQL